MEHQEEMSWSGLGVGTDRRAFLEMIERGIPELDPSEAAEAVVCTLARRVSGGTAQRLFEQLPPDVRELFNSCERRATDNAPGGGREDFYLAVAEHLMVDPTDVRRVIHHVFAALHGQITEAEAERISSELPSDVATTWDAARHNVPAPH